MSSIDAMPQLAQHTSTSFSASTTAAFSVSTAPLLIIKTANSYFSMDASSLFIPYDATQHKIYTSYKITCVASCKCKWFVACVAFLLQSSAQILTGVAPLISPRSDLNNNIELIKR